MTYPEALRYLESFINYEKLNDYDYTRSFKLDRMRDFAGLLGDPQKDVKSVHIAGTKGKGSTAAFIHSILECAGFKTGLYTSPHLASFRERIRLGDSLIKEWELSAILEEIKSAVGKLGHEKPSFFEVYTILAFLYFKRMKADIAVYEVGLGGRLDATNIIAPLVSAITPISYEHTDKLGNTLKEIASEKAGIIKAGVTCVSAPQEAEALETIEEICRQRDAPFVLVGRDVKFKRTSLDEKGQTFDAEGIIDKYTGLKTALLGSHQIVNASTAIGIAESLSLKGIKIDPSAIRRGVMNARWDGRIEVVGRDPAIVLDGAQNRASAKALAEAMKESFRYRRLLLILGVSKDKDLKGILEELVPISDNIVLTKSKVAERAMDPAGIKEFIKKEAILTENVDEALKKAVSAADIEDLILITGSLFVVGEARELIFAKRLR